MHDSRPRWPQGHLDVDHDRVLRGRLTNGGDKKYPSEYGFFETRAGLRHRVDWLTGFGETSTMRLILVLLLDSYSYEPI
jgi:hypothetical protein